MRKLWSVGFLSVIVLSIGCGGMGSGAVDGNMRALVNELENRTETIRLGDESGAFAVVAPELAARIMGISLDGIDGDNLLWINKAIATDEFWTAGGDRPDWNAGGWRTWIAPEKHFYLTRENDWFVPSAMDPGKFKSVAGPAGFITYEAKFTIKDTEARDYPIALRRSIRLLNEPKGGLPHNLSGPVKKMAVEKIHYLRNEGSAVIGEDLHQLDLWALCQMKAAGTCIIPIQQNVSLPSYRDFGPNNFETIPPDRIHVAADYISWKFDGQKRGKLGIHPKIARPYIAYLRTSVEPPILLIKQFDVDPNATYTDSPWDREHDYGDAIQSYNDGGDMGGFSEIESHGPAHPIKQGEELHHTIQLSIYQGSLEDLKKIGRHIMGIDMDKVYLF
jgi:hypothetical protein